MVNHTIAYIGDDFIVPMLVHWDEPSRLQDRLVEAGERSVSVVPVVRNRAARQVGDDRERPHLMTKLALRCLEQHLGLAVRFGLFGWVLSPPGTGSTGQVVHTVMDRTCQDACCIEVEFLCGLKKFFLDRFRELRPCSIDCLFARLWTKGQLLRPEKLHVRDTHEAQ
jgi:hypothetical protein